MSSSSSYHRPYFFEEHFPASYRLCFAPPVQRYPGELNYKPEELERRSSITKDHFQVYVDVKEFQPHEISVKTVNETIIVEGKQDKRPGNALPRHFIRYFRLPEYYDSEDVHSSISEDGILEITALPAATKKLRMKANEAAKETVKE